MTQHTMIVYPTLYSSLGGATYARIGVRFAWISFADGREIRVPLSEVKPGELDSGLLIGERARVYAYRNH